MSRDYRFIDKHPVIDVIRTAYLGCALTGDQVAEKAGISPQTFDNWLYGKTKSPQHRTISAVCRVLGIEIRYVYEGNRNKDLEIEPYVARKFTKAQEKVRRKERRQNREQAAVARAFKAHAGRKPHLRVVNG